MNFGEKLKQLRKSAKKSQKSLANELECSQSILCDWENMKSEPTMENLKKLSIYFGCTVDYLVNLENEDFTRVIVKDTLPPDEERLLQEYRKLDKPIKKMCYYYVEHMVTATTEDKENKKHG